MKETDQGGLKIYTWNSVYILEKAELKEIVYQDTAELTELYLSLEEEYHFARGFYYDKDKKTHELVADVHIGMFTDTVLMRLREDTQYSQYVLFGKLDDASSVTLNATAWCWNHTDATDYIKLNCHFI